MAKQRDITFTPAEFKQIPFKEILAAPLTAVIDAQKVAAGIRLDFIEKLNNAEPQRFQREVFTKTEGAANKKNTSKREVSVPLLAITDVPGLNIDSLSVEFEYEINQVFDEKKEREAGSSLEGKAGIFGGLGSIGLSGSFSSKKSTDYSVNKSGSMSVRLNASESGTPEGLRKVMTWMLQGVDNEREKEE